MTMKLENTMSVIASKQVGKGSGEVDGAGLNALAIGMPLTSGLHINNS